MRSAKAQVTLSISFSPLGSIKINNQRSPADQQRLQNHITGDSIAQLLLHIHRVKSHMDFNLLGIGERENNCTIRAPTRLRDTFCDLFGILPLVGKFHIYPLPGNQQLMAQMQVYLFTLDNKSLEATSFKRFKNDKIMNASRFKIRTYCFDFCIISR